MSHPRIKCSLRKLASPQQPRHTTYSIGTDLFALLLLIGKLQHFSWVRAVIHDKGQATSTTIVALASNEPPGSRTYLRTSHFQAMLLVATTTTTQQAVGKQSEPARRQSVHSVMNILFMMEFINSRSKSCEFPLRLFHPMRKTGVQTSNAE